MANSVVYYYFNLIVHLKSGISYKETMFYTKAIDGHEQVDAINIAFNQMLEDMTQTLAKYNLYMSMPRFSKARRAAKKNLKVTIRFENSIINLADVASFQMFITKETEQLSEKSEVTEE